MNSRLVARQHAAPFALLHTPKRSLRPWWQSALCAGAVYGGLLFGALSWPAQHTAPVVSAPEQLTVTLLDLPQPVPAPVPAVEEPAAGAAPSGAQLSPPSSRPRPRPVEPKPIAKPSEPTEAKPVEPKPSEPAIVAPNPAEPTPLPAVTNPTAGGATTSVQGTGGSGTGTGAIGTGSGAGVAGGVAGGKPGVALPFIDGMTRPSLLSKVDPIYSREALAAGVEGLILTKCVITTRGELQQCKIVKGLQYMDAAVLKALAQWRYTPVMYQGNATAVEYVIPVRVVKP